jgi:hypothetical protein
VSATTEVHADQKAGWCTVCRSGNHERCASPPDRCACHGKTHPRRPAAVRIVPPNGGRSASPRPAAPDKAPRKQRTETTWELVKADPPAPKPKPVKPKKLSPIERAQPLLEAIAEAGDNDWWRIAICGTPAAAGRIRRVLSKEFPEGWEWKASRDEDDRPAVFVRAAAE